MVEATVPYGDAESVERLRERADDAALRAAGGTTLPRREPTAQRRLPASRRPAGRRPALRRCGQPTGKRLLNPEDTAAAARTPISVRHRQALDDGPGHRRGIGAVKREADHQVDAHAGQRYPLGVAVDQREAQAELGGWRVSRAARLP
jgi:hypothetical protein